MGTIVLDRGNCAFVKTLDHLVRRKALATAAQRAVWRCMELVRSLSTDSQAAGWTFGGGCGAARTTSTEGGGCSVVSGAWA